jgi:hypothetical protein
MKTITNLNLALAGLASLAFAFVPATVMACSSSDSSSPESEQPPAQTAQIAQTAQKRGQLHPQAAVPDDIQGIGQCACPGGFVLSYTYNNTTGKCIQASNGGDEGQYTSTYADCAAAAEANCPILGGTWTNWG